MLKCYKNIQNLLIFHFRSFHQPAIPMCRSTFYPNALPTAKKIINIQKTDIKKPVEKMINSKKTN